MLWRLWLCSLYVCFFFKQKTADEMRIRDWSSDVCSSDLRVGRTAAGAQHVLELRLAGQAVAMAALFGQPLGVGLGVPGAHVQHRQVLAGRGAGVVAAPVDAAHPREVAAALVVCHRIAAALRARLASGGVDREGTRMNSSH